MKRRISISVFCVFLLFDLRAQNWELSRDENNIKVYKGHSETSKYKIVKVEAEMHGSLKKLMAILTNVRNNKNWVYHTKESHVMKAINENELLYYSETYLPWPCSNRDIVIRLHFHLDSVRNILKVTATGEPNAAPEVSGKVRVPKFHDDLTAKYIGPNKISIVYFLEVNPGGSISPAISNIFVTKGPFETFNNLSKLLEK
jgi:hypothetical protein